MDSMAATVDDQGRLYLPKHTRERYGDQFRIVELEEGIKLIPLEEDPVTGLRKAMPGIQDVPIGELQEQSEAAAREDALR